MAVTYESVLNIVKNLPTRRVGRSYLLRETVNTKFADGNKLYRLSGDIEETTSLLPSVRMVEEYHTKPKINQKWYEKLSFVKKFFAKKECDDFFEELPCFKKITESVPEYADRGMRITRANGKGLSSVTTVDSNGIRCKKITKQISKDGMHYDYTRYVYDDNGTNPTIVARWSV